MKLILEYVKSFNPESGAWAKRSDAADFGAYLAGELKISPKGVQLDKDGKTHRVFVPLISEYWHPIDNHAASWETELTSMVKKVKKWASA